MSQKTGEKSPGSKGLFGAFSDFTEGLLQGIVPSGSAGVGAPLNEPASSGESSTMCDDGYGYDSDDD